MNNRLSKLREMLALQELDVLLVSTPENRRYMSGFTGSAGYLLISAKDAVLATDFRYIEQAQKQAPLFRIVRIGADLSWFPTILGEISAMKVGFEADDLTVAAYRSFEGSLNGISSSNRPSLLATTGIVEELRSIKDKEEMILLGDAINIGDKAFNQVVASLEPGVTEREVAWRLERAIREMGGDGLAFDTIVGAGPNGAMAHHMPTDRPIGSGEPVVIDMGAKVKGYHSDLTRTICLGEPTDTFHKVYDIVLGAQLTAIATVEAGKTGEMGDALARKVIQEAGYGESFGHGLGHGVGLVIHEHPRVSPTAQNVLQNGMVFTIEPGIYITGWGGVRIEDVVVLENGRARVISNAAKVKKFGG